MQVLFTSLRQLLHFHFQVDESDIHHGYVYKARLISDFSIRNFSNGRLVAVLIVSRR